ncbi:unnamed protein product [Adineta ricciae]|uniref:Uncharacterized protein n=1 Tax=Adineta ricciae TaxID=249248 RepID=A0A816D5B4_ADIRI|nr:unnamed protein product [Adineta ricciae]CAF1632684.1 unnamed protein product [Adineta ricciae]
MKTILLIFVTLFALAFASPVTPVKPPSIIESLSHLLYIHLNPTFQGTLQQLIQLVFQFGERLFQPVDQRPTRSNGPVPAQWVSQLFGEVNSIATQWNNQVTQFFTNIPTIFEKHSRSFFSLSTITHTLYDAVEILINELKEFFVNRIRQVMLSMMDKQGVKQQKGGRASGEFSFEIFFNVFQQQVSTIFEQAKGQLIANIDNAIHFVETYWHDLKDGILDHIF